LLWTLPVWLTMRDYGADSKAVGILSAVKRAMGGAQWDRVRTLHAQGAFQIGDLDGNYESWLDLRHLYSYRDERVSNPVFGAIRSTTGWNGRVSWSADHTGDVCVADSEEARHNAAASVYLDAFAYLLTGAPAAKLRFKGALSADGERFQVVQVSPRDALPFELWVDAETNLIRRVVTVTGVDRTVTVFSDFRPVEGLILPFQVQERESDSGTFSVLRKAVFIEVNREPPGHLFDPPPPVLGGVQFPPQSNSVTLEFRYEDDQIYLPVSINGRRQERFVFDTGSTNTIDTAKAQSLGLKVANAGAAYGGGPKAMIAGLTKVERLDVGELKMADQIIDTVPLAAIYDGTIEGAVGYELAKRTVVIIDYASRRITFLKPESFRRPARATSLSFRFASKSEIVVKGSLNGMGGEYQLDTGQGASLMVGRPFAKRTGLLKTHGMGPKRSASGIGGVVETILFKPSSFAIGSVKPSVSEAEIMLSDRGSGAEEHIAGTVGNGILKQFKVTLDYAHRMVYLEKNASFEEESEPTESQPADIFDFGRPDSRTPGHEGWLGVTKMRRRNGEPVEILEMDANGPAARAGIAKGDLIIAVNGTPVEALTSEAVARAITSPPGSPVKLTVKHGGITTVVTLTTQ
jgi:hypothetical protein